MTETFEQAVDYLYQIPKFTTKNSLDHTRAFLHALGDPQEQFQIIHVAGSNGKGSVCMFLNNILMQTGERTGLFTSPHLIDIRERFLINGEMCTEDAFMNAYVQVKQAVFAMKEKNLPHPTFFEFIFAIGMVLFAKAGVRYAVLETGLGGRLDATNSVSSPLLTIITSISLEHTEYLGDTIPQIAGEKAGIIKPGTPVVYDASEPDASAVIEERAAKYHCECIGIEKSMCKINEIKRKFIDFCLSTEYDNGTRWKIPFVSEYQVQNAALAITGIRMLQNAERTGYGSQGSSGMSDWNSRIWYRKISDLTDEQMYQAVADTRWPGRMEEVQTDIFLDGAHNTAGIREFVRTVRRLCSEDDTKPMLLFSMVSDKDYEQAVKYLLQDMQWDRLFVTKIPDQRGLSIEELEAVFRRENCREVTAVADCGQAFALACAARKNGQKLFCTGSLYFIGSLKEYLHAKERSSCND